MGFKCGRKQHTELIYMKLISSSSLAFHLTTHSRGWLVHQYQKIGTTKTNFWLMCHMSLCRKLTLINALEKKGNSPRTQEMVLFYFICWIRNDYWILHQSQITSWEWHEFTFSQPLVKSLVPYVYFTIRNYSWLG